MRIEIKNKLCPFSHTPGIRYLIPSTAEWVEIFPTLLRFQHCELPLPLTGPIRPFTVENDLEKGVLRIFGKSGSGFFRFFLYAQDGAMIIEWDKPHRDTRTLFPYPMEVIAPKEKLSLGVHKQQDWDLILRRGDMAEIFPLFLRIADWTPEQSRGHSQLLDICRAANKTELLLPFRNLFEAHFQGLSVPTATDERHLGVSKEKVEPLPLLKDAAAWIRSLFFLQQDDVYHLLPKLPPAFSQGRFCQIEGTDGDLIDLEWSKKRLKRVVWNVSCSKSIWLKLQPGLASFRMRKSRHEISKPLELNQGERLELDCFAS